MKNGNKHIKKKKKKKKKKSSIFQISVTDVIGDRAIPVCLDGRKPHRRRGRFPKDGLNEDRFANALQFSAGLPVSRSQQACVAQLSIISCQCIIDNNTSF